MLEFNAKIILGQAIFIYTFVHKLNTGIMKKQKKTSNCKLFLNKETVAILNNYQSSKILGGAPPIITGPLHTHTPPTGKI